MNFLPPSPGWYSNCMMDIDTVGHMVYGTNKNLYLLNFANYPPVIDGHIHISSAYVRISGLSLVKNTNEYLCCVATDDMKINLWNVTTKSVISSHNQHKYNSTSVDCNPLKNDIIASSDEKGVIVVWNFRENDFKTWMPLVGHIVCIKWSPHNSSHLAIGYRSGIVSIVNADNLGEILYSFRSHEDEINDLVWCPIAGTQLISQFLNDESAEDSEEGFLIASSCKNKKINMWCSKTVKPICTFKIPVDKPWKKERFDESKSGWSWTPLAWSEIDPTHLLTATNHGSLISWSFCDASPSNFTFLNPTRSDIKGHSRVIFCIKTGGPQLDNIITLSMDRKIIFWSYTEFDAISCIPTIGGHVHCLARNPHNAGHIAVGTGDMQIRLWNYSNKCNPYECSNYWQKIKSQVVAISWHPVKEGLLGFGTDDGRVGVYDLSSNKVPRLSNYYHRTNVRSLCWGRSYSWGSDTEITDGFLLYSISDWDLVSHETNSVEIEAVKVNDFLPKTMQNKNKCSIAWKPDFEAFAIGCDDGSVYICNAKLIHICSIKIFGKTVKNLAWHPIRTIEGIEDSDSQFWIAITGSSYSIHIIDLKQFLCKESENEEICLITESFHELIGHSMLISDIKWSIHTDGLLASSSYDGSVQIWDVKNRQNIANFRGHSMKVLSVEWSGIDPDIVFSGGDDNSVQAWKISEQEFNEPLVINARKRNRRKNKKNVNKEKEDELVDGEDITNISGNNGSVSTQPSFTRFENSHKNAETVDNEETCNNNPDSIIPDFINDSVDCEMINGDPSKKNTRNSKEPKSNRKVKSLLKEFGKALTNSKENVLEDCVKLACHLETFGDVVDHNAPIQREYNTPVCSGVLGNKYYLGLFMSRPNTYECTEYEIEQSRLNKYSENSQTLQCWKGDLNEELLLAEKNGQLNDYLMALAPSVSPTRWKTLCISYSKQLEKSGEVCKASSYLVAIGKISDAIHLLMNNGFFRDALCLAKLRLSPDDPLIRTIVLKWIPVLGHTGSFQTLSQCYLMLGNPIKAVQVLSRDMDLPSLKACIQILIATNKLDACQPYVVTFLKKCLMKYDWKYAAELIKWNSFFIPFGLCLTVHELLVNELIQKSIIIIDNGKIDPSMYENNNYEFQDYHTDIDVDTCTIWNPLKVKPQTFILMILKRWYSQWNFTFDNEDIVTAYNSIFSMWKSKQQKSCSNEVLFELAILLSLGILTFLSENEKIASFWLCKGMELCITCGLDKILLGFLQLVLPIGPEWLLQLSQEVLCKKKYYFNDHKNPVSDKDLHQNCAQYSFLKDSLTEKVSTFPFFVSYYYFSILYIYASACDCDNGILSKNVSNECSQSIEDTSAENTLEKNGIIDDKSKTLPPLSVDDLDIFADHLACSNKPFKICLSMKNNFMDFNTNGYESQAIDLSTNSAEDVKLDYTHNAAMITNGNPQQNVDLIKNCQVEDHVENDVESEFLDLNTKSNYEILKEYPIHDSENAIVMLNRIAQNYELSKLYFQKDLKHNIELD